MKIGTISDLINKKTIALFLLQFLIVVTFFGYRAWKETSVECVRCHADMEKMTRLGYPHFYVTQDMMEKQSGHPNVKCHECHLGDGRAEDPEKAHKGMLSALFIAEDGSVLQRKEFAKAPLLPQGQDRINEMLPHIKENSRLIPHPDVRNVLWHDRDPHTFNFDPDIAKKTCGRAACHPEAVKQFNTTIMGTNFRQRTMRTWLQPYGPQN